MLYILCNTISVHSAEDRLLPWSVQSKFYAAKAIGIIYFYSALSVLGTVRRTQHRTCPCLQMNLDKCECYFDLAICYASVKSQPCVR